MSIQVTIDRYNTMQARIAAILGTGDAGYGQSVKSIPLVKSGPLTIRAKEINDLRTDLLKVLYHQEGPTYNSALVPAATVPTPGTTPAQSEVNVPSSVLFEKYESALTQIETNKWKLSSDSSQSTTSTGLVSVRNTDWNSEIYHEVKADYANPTQAKYFFNAGGELLVSIAMTGVSSSDPKSTAWATLVNSLGTITMNYNSTKVGTSTYSGFKDLSSAYQTTPILTKTCAAPYEANTYSLYARKQDQFVYLKIVLNDAYTGAIDSVVSGTITSTVKNRCPTGNNVSLTAPTLTNQHEMSADGLTANYSVALTPTGSISEGSDLTISISAYRGLSTIWYKIVGDTTNGNPGISGTDFNDTPPLTLVESVTIDPNGLTTITRKTANDAQSDSCPIWVELYPSNPSPSDTPLATSNRVTMTDSQFTLSLSVVSPVNSTINENAASVTDRTVRYRVTGTSLPTSIPATWTAACDNTSINLTDQLDVITGAITIGGGAQEFDVVVTPNYTTTGDVTVKVKVTVSGTDTAWVPFTITDTSKPTITYTSTKETVTGTTGTAFTYTNPTYTITGGKPDGTYTFTRDSVVSASLQLDSNGSTGAIPFTGLSSPGDLVTKVTFSDTNEEISHTTTFSNDVQVLSVANPLDILDITYGKTLKIDIELTKCYSPTTIEWELLSSPTGIGDSTNSTAQSGEIVTSGNGGIGNGTITLASALNSTRGSTFKVKFSLKSNALLTVSTDDIRIIDAFPHTTQLDEIIYLPTLASAVTIAARGGAGGGGGRDGGTGGGVGGSANTILTKEPVGSIRQLSTVIGKGGKPGVSNATSHGGGAGGAGYKVGGAGGAVRSDNYSGGGAGGGGATAVFADTAVLVVAGGGGGGGGGSAGRDGVDGIGKFTSITNFTGTDGIAGDGGGSGDGGGAGGSGGFVTTIGTNQKGADGSRSATAGTSGNLAYDNSSPMITGTPVILATQTGGLGGTSDITPTAGMDGEVTVYVNPLAPQYPVAALQSGGSDIYYVTAEAPIKDGSAQVLGYTITSSNTPLNGSSELTNTQLPVDDGTFTFTTGTRISFEITADNQFGHGLIAKIPVQTSKVTDITKSGSKFGTSVAMSGDGTRLVVGSPDADGKGAVYVYRKFNNTWDLESTLLTVSPNAALTGDKFGFSVDITDSGDRVVVGSPYRDYAAQTDQGGVYIFNRTGVTWVQEVFIDSPNGSGGYSDTLGYSVNIANDGTFITVGLPGADTPNTSTGQVRLYYLSESWDTPHAISDSATETNALNGFSTVIASDGTSFAYSSPGDNNTGWYSKAVTGLNNAGNVKLITRPSTTSRTWTRKKLFYSPTATADGNFGTSIALNSAGTLLVVGAPGESAFGLAKAGVVHIFAGSGTTWNIQAMLVASDASTNANFGTSVSINDAGDTILVGANNASAGTRTGSGIVYQFEKTGTTWNQTLVITPYDKAAGDSFGTSVSMNTVGDLAVIGAPNSTASGAAYTFEI